MGKSVIMMNKEVSGMRKYIEFRRSALWTSVVFIILGMVLAIYPEMSGIVFTRGLAVGTLIYAAVRFYRWRKERIKGYLAIGDFMLGLVFGFIGLLGIFSPETILSFLPFVTGAALILDGIVKAPVVIEMMKVGSALHIPIALSAVLPLLFGVFLVAFPFKAAAALIMVFGIFLIADGACDIIGIIYFKKYEHEENAYRRGE
ncbi:hypothetical protein DWX08_07985 [Ruminococcus sp. AF18-22]|jgi:uncharacterized membrane protein HdeD (DUF308 family)|nr:hypothetical protein DWX08_07985 [Ruminococcus sp. AF18-22]